MPQFFINKTFTIGSKIKITGSDAHHILDILRLKKNDWIILSDGKGRSYRATLLEVAPHAVEVIIDKEVKRRKNANSPSLAFAIIKHDRAEYIIQKAVELGCLDFHPIVSERTIPKFLSNINDKKLARWQKIALEAAKQSGLPFFPKVSPIKKLDDLCSTFSNYDKVFFLWEGEGKNNFKSQIIEQNKKHLLVIGPEGGFSIDEVRKAKVSGAVSVTLGEQILRVETAAIVSLTVMQYELGNLSKKMA